ncbi:hypothetical protein ACI2OX_19180 [Bacillus sp. N9]
MGTRSLNNPIKVNIIEIYYNVTKYIQSGIERFSELISIFIVIIFINSIFFMVVKFLSIINKSIKKRKFRVLKKKHNRRSKIKVFVRNKRKLKSEIKEMIDSNPNSLSLLGKVYEDTGSMNHELVKASRKKL